MNRLSVLVGALLFLLATVVNAQPYQFELRGGFLQTKSSFEDVDETFEVDSTIVGGLYYLQPVDQTTGPLSERAFLDKAASVGFSYEEADPETGDSVDSIGANARFVTMTDSIFILEYQKTDSSNDTDIKNYRIAAGKYTDDRTTVIGNLRRTDDRDFTLDILSVDLRKLNDGATSVNHLVFEGGLGFVRVASGVDDENGFNLNGGFTYYTSDQLGFSGGFAHLDIDDVDTTRLNVEIEYFFNSAFSISGTFERVTTSFDLDTDILGVGLAARF